MRDEAPIRGRDPPLLELQRWNVEYRLGHVAADGRFSKATEGFATQLTPPRQSLGPIRKKRKGQMPAPLTSDPGGSHFSGPSKKALHATIGTWILILRGIPGPYEKIKDYPGSLETREPIDLEVGRPRSLGGDAVNTLKNNPRTI